MARLIGSLFHTWKVALVSLAFCYKDGTCPDFYRVRCITDGRAGHDDKDAPEGTSMRAYCEKW
ncbi:MAG: hypothetical protein ACLT6Y_03770 [Enterocloster sp.]|uniref:hypothetical protein n=1 Tax=Enterocloster sp. TaxID=2719315 RepID=UPI0039930A15